MIAFDRGIEIPLNLSPQGYRAFLCLARHSNLSGHLCPASHPFTCAGGSMCSRLKWKPTSGAESDCDGTTLGQSSACCPLFGTVPCNGDTRYKCLENPSMQGPLTQSSLP